MFTVTETVAILRPTDEVFAFLTDGRNRPAWDASVISERLTSPPPLGVGSTVRTRLSAMGREVEFDWRVSRFAPPERMDVVSTDGPMRTSSSLRFSDEGAGCRVTATVIAEPTGFMRLAESMISEGVRSTLATGLTRAKALLEARPEP